MVSLLPGQCRGSALEVDELADKDDGIKSADQGATQPRALMSSDSSAV